MKLYEEKGFEVRKGFIPSFFAQYLRNYFDLLNRNDQIPNKGDAQVAKSVCIYGDPAFDTLMLMCLPIVEEVVGKKLLPTYTYARIYFNGADLLPHTDRDACEHSVSLSLGGISSALWPLWFKNGDAEPEYAAMYEGDAVIYQGNKVNHWRDAFEGENQFQLFIHYVEAEGEHKDQLFDTRPYIGLPVDTKK